MARGPVLLVFFFPFPVSFYVGIDAWPLERRGSTRQRVGIRTVVFLASFGFEDDVALEDDEWLVAVVVEGVKERFLLSIVRVSDT